MLALVSSSFPLSSCSKGLPGIFQLELSESESLLTQSRVQAAFPVLFNSMTTTVSFNRTGGTAIRRSAICGVHSLVISHVASN